MRIACFADAVDDAIFEANVSFVDAREVEDGGVGEDEIGDVGET